LRGHGPSADLPKRLVVVAADPDADDEIARESNEHGITIFLGRSGLSEGRYGKRRAPPGAVVRSGIEEVERRRPVPLAVERTIRVENRLEAFGLLSFGKATGDDRIASARDRRIGRGQLEQAHSRRAERKARLVWQRRRDPQLARCA